MVRAEITAQTGVTIETKDKRFPGWRWTADSPDFLRIEPPQSENAYQRWDIATLPGGFFAVRSVVTGGFVNFSRTDHEFIFTSELGRTSEWSFDPTSNDWQLIVYPHEPSQACDPYACDKTIGAWPFHWEDNQYWRLVRDAGGSVPSA